MNPHEDTQSTNSKQSLSILTRGHNHEKHNIPQGKSKVTHVTKKCFVIIATGAPEKCGTPSSCTIIGTCEVARSLQPRARHKSAQSFGDPRHCFSTSADSRHSSYKYKSLKKWVWNSKSPFVQNETAKTYKKHGTEILQLQQCGGHTTYH